MAYSDLPHYYSYRAKRGDEEFGEKIFEACRKLKITCIKRLDVGMDGKDRYEVACRPYEREQLNRYLFGEGHGAT